MKNVLITGGAGFIGFHLAKKILAQNIPVTIADNFSRAVEDADFEQLKNNKLLTVKNVDFLKADELATLGNEYSHIFHLAAIIGAVSSPFLDI